MKKMLLTRDKSSKPRIPRSATLAAKGSSGSYMRKFVRVYPDRFAESKRRLSIDSDVATGIGVSPDRFAESERRSNGNRVLRKFVRLLSVRADNRLQRKLETTSLRQGLKEAASGTEHEAPTEAEGCKSQTCAQAVSLCRRRAGVTEAGICNSQTATARAAVAVTWAMTLKTAESIRQIPTARTPVAVIDTQSVGFAVRLGLGLRLGRPYPSLTRTGRGACSARPRRLRLGRPCPYPSLTRLQQKPEAASCRLLPTIVRSSDKSHQCAKRPNVPLLLRASNAKTARLAVSMRRASQCAISGLFVYYIISVC